MTIENITKQIQEIISAQIGHEIPYDDFLLENGMDSISIIEAITTIEETFNIEFEPNMLNYKLLKSIRTISIHTYNLLCEDKNTEI